MHALVEPFLLTVIDFDRGQNLVGGLEGQGDEQFSRASYMEVKSVDGLVISALHNVGLALADYIIEDDVLATDEHEGVVVDKDAVLANGLLKAPKRGLKRDRNSVNDLMIGLGKHLLLDDSFTV